MTIEKDGSLGFDITCDVCGDAEFLGESEFLLAWNVAKDMGWKARQNDDGEWVHTCPDCLEEGKEAI